MKATLHSAGSPRILPPLAALALLGAALAPSAASASTAANTTIVNTATVNYNDAGNNAQAPVSATASVTVTLVPSAPLVSSPAATSVNQGNNTVLTYTITGTANGQDTYTLASSDVSNNVSNVTPTVQANITLGGTTLAAAANAGANTIVAPYDGNPVNTSLNGLVVGSVIVVGGNTYTITSFTKNAGNNTTTIGINVPLVAGTAVAAGQVVGEQKTFTVTVPSGNVTSGSSGTETITTSGSGTGGVTGTQSTPTVITVNRPTLTVTKLVSTDGGNTFNASANAPPGTVLTYKITATNTGTSTAQAVAFTDTIPQYLTYQPNSGKFSTNPAATYNANSTAVADGAGGYTFNANTVTYNPGSPTGTVAGGNAVLILFFQAKIN